MSHFSAIFPVCLIRLRLSGRHALGSLLGGLGMGWIIFVVLEIDWLKTVWPPPLPGGGFPGTGRHGHALVLVIVVQAE